MLLPAAAVSAQDINDAQIASIVVTANQVDIDAGKLASSKATNPEVKKFAQTMVTDHTGVNKQATALVTKLKVKPEDNATSKSLYGGGQENVTKLKGLKGADPSYDYGTHFLFQGHETGSPGYVTRVNLDADTAHRVTLLATLPNDAAAEHLEAQARWRGI